MSDMGQCEEKVNKKLKGKYVIFDGFSTGCPQRIGVSCEKVCNQHL